MAQLTLDAAWQRVNQAFHDLEVAESHGLSEMVLDRLVQKYQNAMAVLIAAVEAENERQNAAFLQGSLFAIDESVG